ncbi:hypothetical protein HDU83_001258 [Entophlyctis luteolus]|nr:hypothetical protein HDU83_001258 [Entophlyctis luteolus]
MILYIVLALASTAVSATSSLSDICTVSTAQAALPSSSFYPGITIDSSSVSVELVTNSSVSSVWYPSSTISYCNVSFAYSHNGITNDIVHVAYLLPDPADFKNRYVSTGGGGFAINSGVSSAATGIIAGGVSGYTDGGFGSFSTDLDAVFPLSNGTINWQAIYMFGYQAHHELATLGKEFTRNVYGVDSATKVYSYYQGCSEGGREGFSQVQRFADQFDGAVMGAPALRYGQQQANHYFDNVVEQTIGYYPSSCEFALILNYTITTCDAYDGLVDGVVSRSDLCLLNLDLTDLVGTAYYCAESTVSTSSGFGGLGASGTGIVSSGATTVPAQNGTVSAEAVQVVKTLWAGLKNSDGEQVYFHYQPGATFADAATTYDNATGKWGLTLNSFGQEWVARFLLLQDTDTMANIDNVTYDTVQYWMEMGMNRYMDSLQTTYPDLSDFKTAGSKIIHVHGEQDNSIPTASSVRYYDSVRQILFSNMTFNASVAAMDDFYRLYLIPGGAHCSTNTEQPNGGWPQTTLQTMIEWVENGVAPDTLNSTSNINTVCRWPLRPLWTDDGATFNCVYDQAGIDSFIYDLNAYKIPVY